MAVTLVAPTICANNALSGRNGLPAEQAGKPPLLVDDFRNGPDGIDWAPAFNRALAEARRQRRNVKIAAPSGIIPLLSAIEVIPDVDGWTPVILANESRFKLGNVAAGFRYRGRKDSAPENPLSGGLRDCVIDYDNIGDPKVNSGARGVFISNGGDRLRFERVRGINMSFGCHIQNWRYADGGQPGGGLTTVNCDCRGRPSDDRSQKWYPFCDQGDITIEMPGDMVAPGATAVIATPLDRMTSYGAKQPAPALFWTNNTRMPIRVPTALSIKALVAAGLTQGKETAVLHNQTLSAAIFAYWTSGGARKPDCVVQAETGLIDGADHDGGYYGTMLQGTREYFVNRYRSRNNVRGFAGQEGAKNVHLKDVRISQSVSSAILAGYNAPGWTIDDFIIEASNQRWIGEALINIQLGAAGTRIGRGAIIMGNDQKTGQYAVKFGPNSPNCRIDGPLTIKGDCAKAYIAVESAWDRTLSSTNKENYPQADYRGIASQPMTGIQLRNISIEAESTRPQATTAIAIIQASDGAKADGFHGAIGISDLTIENITITTSRHGAYLKFIQSGDAIGRDPAIRDIVLRNFSTPKSGQRQALQLPGSGHFRCVQNVSNAPDHCPAASRR